LKEKKVKTRNKILVIDDLKTIRLSLQIGLGREGFSVDTAGSAEEGLSKFKNGKYDFVISDIGLPKMNGVTLATIIRELNQRVCIILISAYDFADYKKELKKIENCYQLGKPYETLNYETHPVLLR